MVNSSDKPRKKTHAWKKVLIHFSLCFIMGFFIGFAPTTATISIFSTHPSAADIRNLGVSDLKMESINRTLLLQLHPKPSHSAPPHCHENHQELALNQHLIIITTTQPTDPFKLPSLWRLANTLRLVPPPLLWIVVEANFDSPATTRMLRQTGIMYRHITYKENFTDANAEAYHQRNVALNHVEQHRLDGIVLFASLLDIYPLHFFEQIRQIEVFGAWPVARASASRKKMIVEGPICNSSRVVGWQSKELINKNRTLQSTKHINVSSESGNGTVESRPHAKINISGFAFNSSILWDPERWGRSSSIPHSSQDSIRFVHQAVLEDESKIRAIPPDCSTVMMWHLHIQRKTS
ncbi:probable glucuronosyltransferase Os03g0287800 [Phalaenopsis equestris]|uniref:probable glucuronosyltransferase Os03g0287800 n=1 Tax=Phalaenopsis equestris TaxID=78828 RepID=UPI0009E403BC|nr:probable glucuronosyltransferase Os03g0287800 [Phalaenopsis equestris]